MEQAKIKRYLANLTADAKDFLLLQLVLYPEQTLGYIKNQINEFDAFLGIGFKQDNGEK